LTDSVTYELAWKRALPGYENITPFFGVTTDVRDDESFEDAKDRVVKMVEDWMTEKIQEIETDLK